MVRRAGAAIVTVATAFALVVPATAGTTAVTSGLDARGIAAAEHAWRAPASGEVRAAPATDVDQVYVASTAGRLDAYPLHDGERCGGVLVCPPAWTAVIAAGSDQRPVVSGGRVVVGSADGKVLAFDTTVGACRRPPSTCLPRWVADTGAGGTPALATDHDVVYAATRRGDLFAYGVSGAGCTPGEACPTRWVGHASGPIVGRPIPRGEEVYVATSAGRVEGFATDADSPCTGAPVGCTPNWVGTTRSSVTATPSVRGGHVYVTAADGRLHAFSTVPRAACAPPAACDPEWTAGTADGLVTAPTVAGTTVYVGSADGDLVAFDAAGIDRCHDHRCDPQWRGATGATLTTKPTVVAGIVYVGGRDGRISAFAGDGGTRCAGAPAACGALWRRTLPAPVSDAVVVEDDTIFATTTGAGLEAFRVILAPDDPSVPAWPLTGEGRDRYGVLQTIAVDGPTTTVVAPPTNTGSNTRVILRRAHDAGTADGRICATWRTQTQAIDQQGAALRIRRVDEGFSAVTITKNVWLGAAFVFNVHLWDPSRPEFAQAIAQFDLSDVFFASENIPPLPWRMCAQVVGDVVSFKVWPLGIAIPAWGDPEYGGSVRLPPGYDARGGFGMYAGHLQPGDRAGFDSVAFKPLTRGSSRDAGLPARAPEPVASLP
jgi:outer membrane protein assembly factor BamB